MNVVIYQTEEQFNFISSNSYGLENEFTFIHEKRWDIITDFALKASFGNNSVLLMAFRDFKCFIENKNFGFQKIQNQLINAKNEMVLYVNTNLTYNRFPTIFNAEEQIDFSDDFGNEYSIYLNKYSDLVFNISSKNKEIEISNLDLEQLFLVCGILQSNNYKLCEKDS